jgi:hypothetical protein
MFMATNTRARGRKAAALRHVHTTCDEKLLQQCDAAGIVRADALKTGIIMELSKLGISAGDGP